MLTFGTLLKITFAFAISTILACGGGASSPTEPKVDISVTVTSATSTNIVGNKATYQVKVANTGPDTAADVAFKSLVSADAYLSAPVTCVARAGALCPAKPDVTMVLPKLPSGSEVEFTFTVEFASTVNAMAQLSFEATANGEQNKANDIALAGTKLINTEIQLKATPLTAGNAEAKLSAVTEIDTFAHKLAITNLGQNASSPTRLKLNYGQDGISNTLMACTPTGGATCPGTMNSNQLLVPSIPPNGQLDLIFHLVAPFNSKGTLLGDISLEATQTGSFTYTTQTHAVQFDTRNDNYVAFRVGGGTDTLKANFNSGLFRYGNNRIVYLEPQANGNLLAPPPTGQSISYEEARYKDDVILGNFAGNSVIAARKFASSVSELQGSFVSFSKQTDRSGQTYAITHAQWESNGTVYRSCTSQATTGSIVGVSDCSSFFPNYTASVSIEGNRVKLTTNGTDTSYTYAAKMGNAILFIDSFADPNQGQYFFKIGVSPVTQRPVPTAYPLSLYGGRSTTRISGLDPNAIGFQVEPSGVNSLSTTETVPLAPQSTASILGLWGGQEIRRFYFGTPPSGYVFFAQGPIGISLGTALGGIDIAMP